MRSKPQTLIAAVYSGLGNRMRVLLSARDAAARNELRFRYYWQIDHRFQARIQDLWEIDSKRIGPIRYAYDKARHGSVEKLTGDDLSGPGRTIVLRSQQPVPSINGSLTEWKESLRGLTPSPQIRDRVKALWQGELKSEPYVAVMVRAHAQSHQVTKETSPPSWFIERMLNISKEHPGIKFFLSCDHVATQEEIMAKVPNVVAQNKTSRYNSREGVVDAVVDLYLAAFGVHIIGPHWSSFVDMAEALSPGSLSAETPVLSQVSTAYIEGAISNWQRSSLTETYPWLCS